MAMLLEMRNISKSFPGVKALNGFSIDLKAGEVHALVGENGAGKSTLIKTLYGIHQPDGGEIVIDGVPTKINGPADALSKGIGVVFQELSVCPHLDIANNIFLGCIKNKRGIIDDRFAHEEAARLMEEAVGLRIPSDTPMKDLSIADQQMVEITKVTSKGCRIVVFDEPTSSLTENEIERLFKIIFALKKKGVGIIYISHRLEELPVIADRITVMRDGTRVKTMDYKDTNDNEIISLMVGRELSNIYPTYKRTIGEVVFEADNIRQGTKLDVKHLDVRKGEILGIAGLVGAGRTETLRALFGADDADEKHVKIEGKEYTAKAMTGQNRKHRKIDLDFAFDSETVGFYQSIGIQEVGRSLPYQPWDKPIERFFSTVCSKFSKWFESYTGTLTGSKTYAKRQKDIDQMLERGELLTMEEFFEVWTEWKNTKYHTRKHRGLSDAGEKWVTPIEMFENGPRYEKAAPPREYAAMLLMKAATARVTNQGINKFGTLYTDTELAYYVNQKVNIKWDIDDVTKLYVYDMDGKKICEAVSAELLAFGPHCSQAALEKHLRDQKRNEREVREYLEERVRPYELRLEDGARPSDAVGMIDLTIKATPSQKLVSLPKDRMFRSEQASKASRKKVTDDTFLNAKGDKALSLLRAMNE